MDQTRRGVSRKLAGLSLMAFIGMAALATLNYYQIDRVFDSASNGSMNTAPSLAVLEELEANFLNSRLVVYRHFQYRPEAFKLGVIEPEAREYRVGVAKAIEQYKSMWVTDSEDEAYINKIEKRWLEYDSALDKIVFELHVNTENASDLVQRSKPIATEIETLIHDLIEYKIGLGQQGVAVAEEIRRQTIFFSILITLSVALAIAASVYIFTRKITEQFTQALEDHGWVKSSISALSLKMQKTEDINDFAQLVVMELARLLKSGAAGFYILQGEHYDLLGKWGVSKKGELATKYRIGEGLVGQCAQNALPIMIDDVPNGYLRISSGLGEAEPNLISLIPILSKEEVIGVLEFALFAPMTHLQEELIEELLPVIALNLEVIKRNNVTKTLLHETQEQAKQLQASEEELRMQSEELQASEEELRAKSDAQRMINEELKRQGEALHEAREIADRRAAELEKVSQYKSEFLANMSHELRTPLNSLLILAKDLAENEDKNLSADQVESAQIIFDGGESLLRLINDILDLSKVEAGKMVVCIDDVNIEMFAASIKRNLKALAKNKALKLEVDIAPDVPATIQSDVGKLEQIIMNLVGNAFKFTSQGSVMVRFSLLHSQDKLSIAVEDTGIGIPSDKLESVFEAFEQVDGSTRREHGGTGLGLPISRQLAALLGGEITVTSVEGKGCTFALILPLEQSAETVSVNRIEGETTTTTIAEPIVDQSAPSHLATDERRILVVDHDATTQQSIVDMGLEQVMLIAASDGQAALDCLLEGHVDCMVLELDLADMSGFTLLERIIEADAKMPEIIVYTNKDLSYEENLKLHEYTDSIVVKSTRSSERLADELRLVLDAVQLPPVSQPSALPDVEHSLAGKTVLIVEDDMRNAFAMSKVLRGKGLTVLLAQDGFKALTQLDAQENIDIVLMDIMMPGKDGYETIVEIRQQPRFDQLPIIALTAKAMQSDRKKCLKAGANDYLSKPVDIKQLLTVMTSLLQAE